MILIIDMMADILILVDLITVNFIPIYSAVHVLENYRGGRRPSGGYVGDKRNTYPRNRYNKDRDFGGKTEFPRTRTANVCLNISHIKILIRNRIGTVRVMNNDGENFIRSRETLSMSIQLMGTSIFSFTQTKTQFVLVLLN